MIRCFVCLLLLFTARIGLAENLTIERLFADPSLSGSSPRALRYSPDGSRVTFLKGRDDDYDRYDLWEYHLDDGESRLLVSSSELFAGEESLSDEEKARRERQRIFGRGIMEYLWDEDGTALIFPLAGDVYHYDLETKKVRRITATDAFETDLRGSPLGQYVSFIRDQDLVAVDLRSGKERQLTRDGGGAIKNGMAEFVAQEEMGRYTGYWWSPDDRHVAFLQVDESPVDLVARSEIYADRIDMVEQRYPAAGRPNVTLRLGVLNVQSGETRWLDLGAADDFYIPRVDWASDSQLTYQWQSRNQQRLELRLADLESGQTRTLLVEESPTWVNLHKDLHFVNEGERFVWSSERSGFRHLYLYSLEDGLLGQLTEGNWSVDQLSAVNEERGRVYFTGRRDTPLERHLYQVPLEPNGQAPQRLSQRSGMHSITFAEGADSYLDSFSSALTPPQVSLHKADGSQLAWVEENAVTQDHPLYPYAADLVAPEFGHFTAEQGHELYYRLYKPSQSQAGQRHPVVVYVYGGPGVQVVKNQWDRLFMQYLVQQGYVVFSVDNRGSAERGKAFEDGLYKNMGGVEVEDQRAGLEFLKRQSFVDASRMAVYGHSYGGYMALMSLFKAGDYLAAGVSGAPVTDWGLYDTHYTERYMGNPSEGGDDYLASSVFPYLENLEDPLLLYHGMADDNVLFTNSTRLMKALQDSGKRFDLMTYPGKKHSIRGKETRVHLYTTIAEFLDRHLKPGAGS